MWCKEAPGFPADLTVLNRYEDGVAAVFRAIRKLRAGDAVILNGALGADRLFIDLLFGIYLRVTRRRVTMLIADATWHPRTVPQESRARWLFPLYAFFLKRLLLACETPYTHYCFLSHVEVEGFVKETGVPPERVHFTPFCTQLPLEIMDELDALARLAPERRVFAGGNSLRDYDTLISAGSELDGKVVIASSNTPGVHAANVEMRFVDHHAFFRIMARSAVVVVPLIATDKRSVGQQTYLNAMALGKLVIVSDVSGVRDHLTPGVHAITVPPGDVAALRAALVWSFSEEHAQEARQIAEAGRTLVSTMTFAHYCQRLGSMLRQAATSVPA